MLKTKINPVVIAYHVIKNDAHKLETSPATQLRYHTLMTRYWLVNFPVIIFLFFAYPKLWIAIALFINTIYSLYANLATDFGAIPSAHAAMVADQVQAKQDAQEPFNY